MRSRARCGKRRDDVDLGTRHPLADDPCPAIQDPELRTQEQLQQAPQRYPDDSASVAKPAFSHPFAQAHEVGDPVLPLAEIAVGEPRELGDPVVGGALYSQTLCSQLARCGSRHPVASPGRGAGRRSLIVGRFDGEQDAPGPLLRLLATQCPGPAPQADLRCRWWAIQDLNL